VQAINAETMGALARMGAGELGKETLAIALRLKAMRQAVRLMQTDPNQLLAMQLWRCLGAAWANLEQGVVDLSATGSPDTTIAELLGRRESLAKAAVEGLQEARRFRVEPSLGSLEYQTSSGCESWCLSGDPQTCDGYSMSAEDVVVASAAGGRFDGDVMRFPVAVVYSSISYPQGLAGVQLVPRGPYAAKGTSQGWLELLPDEACQLADALRHHADQVTGKDHSC
jgi:hypothetical protein